MELWQLDEFTYHLASGQINTIYQLIDDATHYDIGTYCAVSNENRDDACRCLAWAFNTYGVPQQLLTYNGAKLN